MIDYQKTSELLIKEYGVMKGMQMNAIVLPNVIKDFEQILRNAPRGAVTTEEYRFDDIKGSIKLTGCDCKITEITVNHSKLQL